MKSLKAFRVFLYGVCMGAADIVPGISGSTVAFALGFYQTLIHSLTAVFTPPLFPLRDKLKKQETQFLSQLFFGVVFALLAFARPLCFLLNQPLLRSWLFALFMGCIVSTAFTMLKAIFPFRHSLWLHCLIPFCLMLSVSLREFQKEEGLYSLYLGERVSDINDQLILAQNYDLASKTLLNLSQEAVETLLLQNKLGKDAKIFNRAGQRVFLDDFGIKGRWEHLFEGKFVFAGACAMVAMLLPGLSGSYILLLLGLYPIVVGAVADMAILHNVSQALHILLNFGLGVLLSMVLFSRLLSYLLDRYPHHSKAWIGGSMLGALPSLWPFWEYDFWIVPLQIEKGIQLRVIAPTFPDFISWHFFVAAGLFLIGFIVISRLEFSKSCQMCDKAR